MKYVKSQFDSDQFEGCAWLRCAPTGTFITHHCNIYCLLMILDIVTSKRISVSPEESFAYEDDGLIKRDPSVCNCNQSIVMSICQLGKISWRNMFFEGRGTNLPLHPLTVSCLSTLQLDHFASLSYDIHIYKTRIS